MTTKAAAIYNFWSSFGLPTYEENSVPTGTKAPKFPYITYEFISDAFGNEVHLTASLWYRSNSVVEINAKAEEISRSIGWYKKLDCEGGAILIKRGRPFASLRGDDSDDMIKRKIINITAEYITNS